MQVAPMPNISRKTFLLSLFGGPTAAALVACRNTGPAPAGTAGTPNPAPVSPAPSRADKILERAMGDFTAAWVVGAVYIGDRLGLFKAMHGAGPLDVRQLAAKTGFDARYVAEWLRSMATSGYIDYHPATGAFELPSEHAAVLVDEDSPMFIAGWCEGVVPDILMIPRVMEAFRTGKGIPYGDYPAETFDSIERGTRPDYLHLLTQQWLPAVPGVVEKLRAGGRAADLGSGAGLASIAIAKGFPKAVAVGFEPYAPSVARARQNAKAAGVDGRVTFETFDGVNVPGGPYDLVTINYSLHHAGDPVSLMRSARKTLAPGGVFLVVEYRKSVRLEEDVDTIRRAFYPSGLLECLPTALAEGGPGFGTGIIETDVRKLATASGFGQCTRVLEEDPMRSFFVLRA
jgi:SAM-dependent methyltransferase